MKPIASTAEILAFRALPAALMNDGLSGLMRCLWQGSKQKI